MKEADIMRLIQVKFSEIGTRLFRNNVGMGWVGNILKVNKPTNISMYPGDVLIRKARPFHAGLGEDSPDLIGFTSEGKFIGIEVKAPGKKPRKGQKNFLDVINKSNGVGFSATSPEEALQEYKKYL